MMRRLVANVREASRGFLTSDYWLTLVVGAATAVAALILLWPGDTLRAYSTYAWIHDLQDPVLGLPLLTLGAWALLARTPRGRRLAAIAMCVAWGGIAFAIVGGNVTHVRQTEDGPSLANLWYVLMSALAYLAAVRATAQDQRADRGATAAPDA